MPSAFQIQRKFAPAGPLVNSEFYPGWLDLWGVNHSRVGIESILVTLEQILEANANVNFYMFHGGTTFAYGNGAEANAYTPQVRFLSLVSLTLTLTHARSSLTHSACNYRASNIDFHFHYTLRYYYTFLLILVFHVYYFVFSQVRD